MFFFDKNSVKIICQLANKSCHCKFIVFSYHFWCVSKKFCFYTVSRHSCIQCEQNFLESSLKCDTFDNFRWKRQKLKLKPYTKYFGMLIICTKIFALKFFQIPWAWYCKVRLSVWRFCLGTKRIKKVMKFHT